MHKQNILNLIFSYAGFFLGLFNTFLKPKIISAEEIGLIVSLTSMALIVSPIILIGTPSIIMKFYPDIKEKREKDGFLVAMSFLVLFFNGIAFFIFLAFKAYFLSFYDNSLMDEYANFFLILLFLNSFTYLLQSITRILYKSVQSNFVSNFVLRFGHVILLLVCLIFKLDFKEYFYMFVSLSAFVLLLLAKIAFSEISFFKCSFAIFTKQNNKLYSTYGFFRWISGLSSNIVLQIDKIMIGVYIGLGNAGIYSISLAVANTLGLIISSLVRIAQPRLSGAFAKNDIAEVRKIYNENLHFQIYLGLYVYMSICLFAQDILAILGEEYVKGVMVLILIATGHLINVFVGMCGEAIALSKYHKFDFYSRISLIVVVVISNYLLIPAFGINGAAIATCFSYFIYDFLKMYYAYKKFKIHPFQIIVLKFLFIAVIQFISIHLLVELLELKFNLLGIVGFSILNFAIYDFIVTYILKYKYSLLYTFVRKIK